MRMAAIATRTSEDVGSIISMEHINVTIPDQLTSTLFYIVGMGFTRDPFMNVGLDNMWVNVGEQQFHLPTRPEGQCLRGHTGIVMQDPEALKSRLDMVAPRLKDTEFSWREAGDYIEAVSPWGNVYRVY